MKKMRFNARSAAKVLAAVALLCAALAAMAIIVLSSSSVSAPPWLREPIKNQIQSQFGARTIDLGNIGISLRISKFLPIIQIQDLHFLDTEGATIIEVEELDIELALGALLKRQARPTAVEARGVFINQSVPLSRQADPGAQDSETPEPSYPGVVGTLRKLLAAMDSGPLASTVEVRVEGATIEVPGNEDSEVWRFTDGRALLRRSATEISGQAAISPPAQLGPAGELALQLDLAAGRMEPRIQVSFQDLAVKPVAGKLFGTWDGIGSEFAATGTVSIQISETGKLQSIDTELQVGSGTIHVRQLNQAMSVSAVHVTAAYVAEAERVDIRALSIDSDFGHVAASGSVYIDRKGNAESTAVFGSLRLDETVLHPPGVFQEKLESISGFVEFRLHLGKRTIEFAQFSLAKDTTRLVASGTLAADAAGLQAALDFHADRLSRDDLLAWWPVNLVPATRVWLLENLLDGEFSNVVGAFRHAPGRAPELLLTFRVRELMLRYLDTLPPIRRGSGHASLTLKEFDLSLEEGNVTVPNLGDISVAGSSFHIPEIDNAAASSEVRLKFDGRMGPVLAVLNYPPFAFLDAAGIPADIVGGRAMGTVNLRLPLLKSIKFKDLRVRADGTITDYSSKEVIGGRTFFGETLDVAADNSGIEISGKGILGSIPVSGVWSQEFGPDSSGGSSIVGSLEISDAFLSEFDIELPEQTLSGAADTRIYVSFSAGAPPKFVATSDVSGLTIDIPFLHWGKPAGIPGELIVEGNLMHPIALQRIDFEANTLAARGRATLLPNGELESAVFDHFGFADWLDATASITRQGNGELAYKITGGTIDFQKANRAFEFSSLSERAPSQVDLTLDRLELTSGITLTDLSGSLGFTNQDLNQFSANLNGGPLVNLKIVKAKNGAAVRVGSSNAGDVFRALKLTKNLHGGTLEALFTAGPGDGKFQGILEIRDATARNMPTLSEILSYVSVVGLIDKLTTKGISFDAIDAEFDISEKEVVLHRGTAVGQSLGVTMKGTLDLSSSELDMAGVITPAYALNRLIDSVTPISTILGIEKGEGLGAVDYALHGPVDDLAVAVNPISVATPGFLRGLIPAPSAER